MYFYKFNISDYLSHTAHLTEIEDLAYRRMLDWYYLHEKPLPLDVDLIAKNIRMRTHSESIANVLREFFHESEDGFQSNRANSEILSYTDKSDKAKESAKARWGKNKNKKWGKNKNKNKTLKKNANALRTECEGNAKHKTLNTKQETLIIIPNGINLNAWNEWIDFRKAKKKPVSQLAATKQFELLLKYNEQEQQAIINNSITNDYQGLFEPKVTHENSSRNEPYQDNSAAGKVRAAVARSRAEREQAEN